MRRHPPGSTLVINLLSRFKQKDSSPQELNAKNTQGCSRNGAPLIKEWMLKEGRTGTCETYLCVHVFFDGLLFCVHMSPERCVGGRESCFRQRVPLTARGRQMKKHCPFPTDSAVSVLVQRELSATLPMPSHKRLLRAARNQRQLACLDDEHAAHLAGHLAAAANGQVPHAVVARKAATRAAAQSSHHHTRVNRALDALVVRHHVEPTQHARHAHQRATVAKLGIHAAHHRA